MPPHEVKPDLIHFLEEQLLPILRPDQIYVDPSHRFNRSNGKWRGACPWHNSNSGTSFVVNPKTLEWWCQGCHVGGGPIQYLYRLRGGSGTPTGRDFRAILRELAKLAGIDFPEIQRSEADIKTTRQREARRAILRSVIAWCRQKMPPAVKSYLNSRGFPEMAIDELGLGFYASSTDLEKVLQAEGHSIADAKQSGVLWRKLEGYISFPWCDPYGNPLTIYGSWQSKQPPYKKDVPVWRPERDRAYADWNQLSAERKAKTPWIEPRLPKKMALPNPKDDTGEAFDETKRSPLYFDRARQGGHKHVVLVEGVTDAGLLQSCGDTRVIACASAAISKLQADTLTRHRVERVTICLDPDEAGESGVVSTIKTLTDRGVVAYVAPRLPDGLDPDEFVIKNGLEAWNRHIDAAIHGYRYMAQIICVKHKAGGWTDAGISSALKDGAAFYRSVTAEGLLGELTAFFIPALSEFTELSIETVKDRLQGDASDTETSAESTKSPLFDALETARVDKYIDVPPKPYAWLLKDTLLRGAVGSVIANGGLGKSYFLLQMAITIASWLMNFLGLWEIGTGGKVYCLFCEDEESIIHHRVDDILRGMFGPQEIDRYKRILRENLYIHSGVGFDTRLIKMQHENYEATPVYSQLLDFLKSIPDLKLVILDPLSHIGAGAEENQAAATFFVQLLQRISIETGAAVLFSHHSNKLHGSQAGQNALIQEAARGASSLTNAVRWQLNVARMDQSQVKRIGGNPDEYYRYLMGKVAKKNVGPPEDVFYLHRSEGGVLTKLTLEHNTSDDGAVLDQVCDKILEIESSGQKTTKRNFCVNYAGVFSGYGRPRLETIVNQAIESQRLTLVPGKDERNRETMFLSLNGEGNAPF